MKDKMIYDMDDEKLYCQYLKGDESAAAELVKRYGDLLTIYINGYVHDLDEAEDMMIEAFSLIFAKERPIVEKGHFRAYLYKTARNLTIRHNRRHGINFISYDSLPFEPEAVSSSLDRIVTDEDRKQLYDAIGDMNNDYREALYLIYFEDMTYRQASAIMGKNTCQLTNLVHRGKKQLRSILEKRGFSYENR